MSWKELLRNNFTKWEPLCDFLQLDDSLRAQVLKQSAFPLNLPLRLAEKIAKNRLDDPILRQFVPLAEEGAPPPVELVGYSADPLQEASFCKSSKFLHKYHGRALLVSTSACAMHCRFCFRRHFPYDIATKGFEEELNLIANDPTLQEIIVSGGDPLSLSNDALGSLLNSLENIPHVKRVRFHTRFPIGFPERLEPALLGLLDRRRFQIWLVIHCNHAIELDDEVLASLKAVQKLGIPVLNQGVLLKGVNDDVSTLEELYSKLVDHGILPYYLFVLDRVEGAHHFDVPEEIGIALIEQLRARMSGYGVPKLVREIPGKLSKTSLV